MPENRPVALVGPRVLATPRSMCNACVESLDDLDWVASSTLHVGPWAVGVRSTSAAADAALRRILAAHLLDDVAPPYFSVLVPDESTTDGNARSLNFLYRSSDTLVRTRAPGRVLRALLQYLSDLVEPPPPTVRLNATGLIIGSRAIVAPDGLRAEMAAIETRLNAAGMRVIDAPVLHLDPDTGHLIVPEPALTIDADALAEFEDTHPPLGRESAPVPPGRYPISAWALVTAEDHVGRIGRARALAGAAQQVANADAVGAQQALDVVSRALAQAPVSGIWWREPAELVAQLRALANEPDVKSPQGQQDPPGPNDTNNRSDRASSASEPGSTTIEIPAEEIDGGFVPSARSDVAAVHVDREIVLGRNAGTDSRTQYLQTCALNESGSVVWQCFDGSGTLDEIAADIADVFGAEVEAVSAEVQALAREVGALGFLAGVHESVLEIDDEPSGIPVGLPFPDFDAEDESGRRLSAAALRGRRSLLVSWSPSCTFCEMIAPDLAELGSRLSESGVDIVLLSTGGSAANRRLLDRSNLTCRLLLQHDEIADGFDGMGTPVAYLVDEHGNVAEALALGAPAVLNLARRVAGARDSETP